MLKKLISMAIAVIMVTSLSSSVFAASTPNYIAKSNNIVYLNSDSINTNYSSSDIVVMSEEQLLEKPENVKKILNSAKMLYVTTSLSQEEIKEICYLTSLVSVIGNEVESKIATAIDYNDGYYNFHDVVVLEEGQHSTILSASSETNTSDYQTLVTDGISAVLKTCETKISDTNTRMQPSNPDAFSQKSAIVYDGSNKRVGSMGFTTYFYKKGKYTNGGRIFDTVAVSTFAPDNGYACKKMTVSLNTTYANHSVLEAANIISNNQSTTHSLGLSADKDGLLGSGSTSWSYTVDAQTVTKSFDMMSNSRKWTFQPKSPGNGDAWIEEPGVRTYLSTGTTCYMTVNLSCPFYNILGFEVNENTIGATYYFTYP